MTESGIASLHVGLRLGLLISLSGQAAALGETLHGAMSSLMIVQTAAPTVA